ncbi:outer membrane protein assembly factor BamB family protein [Actinophytocola sediminis]
MAIGLGVAGVAALVVAWALGNDFVEPTPAPGWTRAGTVVLILVLTPLVWTRRRAVVLTAAVVALAVTVLAVLGFFDQYSRGFPGRATVVAALGGLAVTVGALLAVRGGPRAGRRPVTVGAFLLVPVVATPLALAAPGLPVEATTAGAVEAAALPASVSEVAWSTGLDGQVRDVVAAGAGVVVLLTDGVVALDGQTGDLRWRRTRHGAQAEQLGASPDGRTVVVEFQPRDLSPGTRRDRSPVAREVIDAFTGEVRFTTEDVAEERPPFFVTPVTDNSYVGATADEQEFFGNSLTDGTRLWSYRPPRDCQLMSERTAQLAVAAGMLLPLACGTHDGSWVFTEFRYVLVDGRTGDVRWEHRMRMPKPTDAIDVLGELAPDRRLVALHFVTDGSTNRSTAAILDVGTGDPLPFATPVQLLAGGIGVLRTRASDQYRLIDVTTGETVPGKDDLRQCAATYFGAFLDAGVVCVSPALTGVDRPINFDRLVETGRIELAVGTYESQETHLVPVTLGPPHNRLGSDEGLFAVAAPGAVVVAAPLVTANDAPVQVVGLR